MNTKQKIQEGLQHVSNEHFYKPLTRPIINALFTKGHIDQMTHKWLSLGQNPPQIPQFYTLTKIYKAIPVSRPIVYGSGGPTERISSFVDSLLQPMAQKQRALLHHGHYAHFILNFGIENTPLLEAAILATLGPISFTFYVDDLINEISNSQAEMYVDDCQLFLKFKVSDSANVNSAVNNDLIRMSTWCSHNSLLINPKKTKLLVAGLPQLLLPVSYVLYRSQLLGKTISPVLVAKDLGVYLDQCLNYNTEKTKSASTCFLQLVQVNRVKYLLDLKSNVLLINSFVFIKLFYCSSVWGNTVKSNINKLQLERTFAARIVFLHILVWVVDL